MIQSRVVYSALSLLLIMFILSMLRPSVMFKRDGTLKEFGFGEDKTLYSLSTFSLVIAILLFYFFSVMDIIFLR